MSRRIGIKTIQSIGGRELLVYPPILPPGQTLDPAAWTYDNVPAKISQSEPCGSEGGYYDSGFSGTGHVREPEGSDGGYYDNRT